MLNIHSFYYSKSVSLILFFVCITILIACKGFQGFGEQVLYNQADRAHKNGEYEKAIRIYKKLLAQDPYDKVIPNNAVINYDLVRNISRLVSHTVSGKEV